MSAYRFFITNNEQVNSRVEPRDKPITFSSRSFMTTKDQHGNYIFQIVSDLHFSMVSPKTGEVEYDIVAFSSDKSKSVAELDYFSKHCKKILKFKGKIEDNISLNHGKNLILNSSISRAFLNEIFQQYLPQELIDYIYEMTDNVELELMINDYYGNYYISNPSFKIKSNYLKYLVG